MLCFNHPSAPAFGICRTCGKGVCPACVKPDPRGLVCSDPCREFMETQYEMIERARRVYNLGAHKQRFPVNALIPLMMGVAMLGFGAWTGRNVTELGVYFDVMGALSCSAAGSRGGARNSPGSTCRRTALRPDGVPV